MNIPPLLYPFIGFVPSFLKKFLYKNLFGFEIGNNVNLKFGSFIYGPCNEIRIDSGVTVDYFTILKCSHLSIGYKSSIGMFTVIAVPKVIIGDYTSLGKRVWVSTGMDRPTSSIEIGDHSMIMERSYINAADKVKIGNNVGIGGHALLFTHGYWSNVLKGYPRSIAPVIIEDNVWLPWRVFVMPGTYIGEGAVIGANTTVFGTVKSKSLVVSGANRVIEDKYSFAEFNETNSITILREEIEHIFSFNGFEVQREHSWISKGKIRFKYVFNQSDFDGSDIIFIDLILRDDDFYEYIKRLGKIRSYFNVRELIYINKAYEVDEIFISIFATLGLRFSDYRICND